MFGFSPRVWRALGRVKSKESQVQSRAASCCCTCIYLGVVSPIKNCKSRKSHDRAKRQPEAMGKTFRTTLRPIGWSLSYDFPRPPFHHHSHVKAFACDCQALATKHLLELPCTSITLPALGLFASAYRIRTLITCLA
jgi:hypothetical protein